MRFSVQSLMMDKQKIQLLFALNCFNRAAVYGPPEPPAARGGAAKPFDMSWIQLPSV